MLAPTIICPPALKRRLPFPSFGIDVNFCRNPQCKLFAEPPDPYIIQGRPSAKVKSNLPRGEVVGAGDDKTFKCGSCSKFSIIKNNAAVVEEYRRLRGRFNQKPRGISAQTKPVRTIKSCFPRPPTNIGNQVAQRQGRSAGNVNPASPHSRWGHEFGNSTEAVRTARFFG